MNITKSDLHSVPRDPSGYTERNELVVVIRADDIAAIRKLRDHIELLVDIHSRGPICTITEHNITPDMFEAAAALLGDKSDRLHHELRSHFLTPDGPIEYRAELRRGMVRVTLGKQRATVERRGQLFCVHVHDGDKTLYVHHVPDGSDTMAAIVHAAGLLANETTPAAE